VRLLSSILFAALAIASLAAAQTPQGTAAAPVSIANIPDPVVNAVVSAVMPRLPGRSSVKGSPFSAIQTTTHEQTLEDGTIIKSTVELHLWRDTEGRMRAEGKLKSNGTQQGRIVSVWNPLDGTTISWISGNPSATFATVTRLPESQINRMVGALAAVPPPPSTPGSSSRLQQWPAPASQNPDTGNIHTETLPKDNIAGIDVTGTRTTQIIAAGTADNDRDITVVSETWASPDLGYTIRQSNYDPRCGRITTELTNIDRVEPDPSLFKMPDGYKVMEIPQPPSAPR
jgi:hypothetical protein